MVEKIKRLGILTSGGDAPGLNGVIRAAVKVAILKYRYKITGIRDGFEGLLMKDGFVPVELKDVRGILPRGGTILGTRNSGRFSIFFEDSEERERRKLLSLGIRALKRNKIDALIAIGGEGSLFVANEFHKAGIPIIGVPKTIDNDLASTDYTFGFDTAVSVATEALDRLATTAEAHGRVMILEVMGRHAGWIALGAGIAGGADVILIPEIPFSVTKIAKHIKLRESTGATSHIIVVAEGAFPKGAGEHLYVTAGGKKRLGGIAGWLSYELGKKIKNEIRYTVLGHIQRGGTPSSFDRILASRFGSYAVKLISEGTFGHMVCLKTPNLSSVPMDDAINVYHKVDTHSDLIRAARNMGLAVGD